MIFLKVKMGKGGWYVYIRGSCDCPEYMKMQKPILEKNKNNFKKMKISKIDPFSPTYPPYKKNQ